jgi:two-component system sensor histidine kinase HydH
MKSRRGQGAISLPLIIVLIIAGALVLSIIFYSFFHKLNLKVETVLEDQFNQQQLMLARKIADNVEAYFDYLENMMTAFSFELSEHVRPGSPGFNDYMEARYQEMQHMGILEVRWYDSAGVIKKVWNQSRQVSPAIPAADLTETTLEWIKNPQNCGRLLLGQATKTQAPPLTGRLVMPLVTPVYRSKQTKRPEGAIELLIDPLFICGRAIQDVRSGQTGYAWIINQNGVFLAHHETDFIGHDAIQIRIARNPKITYQGIKELHERIFRGEEGTGTYISGWHRQKIGEMKKLYGFTTIRFDKGLVRGVTDVAEPVQNLWGVAVAAPVAEVSGQVWEVLYQELALGALFFLVVIISSGVLIGVALTFNKRLSREVELKTKELKESHEQLVRSERFAAVGEAAAYVSHEIKNPLMVIGGLAQQVGRRLEQELELQEKLGIIQGEVRRLENFLGDLRDFTRPALPAKERIHLNQIIHEVHTLMDAEAQKRNITISEHLDPQLPRLEADPNQMKQVLLNILKNALEAVDSGDEIILKSGVEDGYIWFSVKDNGPGIPPEVLEKIFDPFFTTKEKGTGLGLAVIHKIITDHQGTVAVESEPGKGATVTVKLPWD